VTPPTDRREPSIFGVLRIARFRRLYISHTVSLLGDAFTWIGLALLAYQLAGAESSIIVGSALTLRVIAYVVVAPGAGALADRFDRRWIMVAADLVRMLVVAGLFFATEVWQVYALMFVLNVFTALFRPAFEASIPETAGAADAPRAIALAGATTELLGVLGPGIAGGIAALVGTRWLFAIDAASFLLSGLVLLTLSLPRHDAETTPGTWLAQTLEGSRLLWRPPALRIVLGLELAAAISGAIILVNSVLLVRGVLREGESEYGWVMMGLGLGATLAALIFPRLKPWRRTVMMGGAAVSALALLPVALMGWTGIVALWALAGIGQNWVNLGAQTIIAEEFAPGVLGRVYGAHFAWSHLWWVGAYPLAGWLGSAFEVDAFAIGGAIALVLTGVVIALSMVARREG
jgi:MFS transporter, NRE family, putaive nickel resistance protein